MIMTAQVGTNFDSELGSADIVLVNFYAPWYTPLPPAAALDNLHRNPLIR